MTDSDDLAALFARLTSGQRIELGRSLLPPADTGLGPSKYRLPVRPPSERLAAHQAHRED